MDICECSHIQGDHQSNRAPFPHPLIYGVCMVDGCGCTAYSEADEAGRRRLRQLEREGRAL